MVDIQITKTHALLKVDVEAGNLLDSFSTTLTTPLSVSRNGTLYVFEKLFVFHSSSILRGDLFLPVNFENISSFRSVSFQGLEVKLVGEGQPVYCFQWAYSPSLMYSTLLKATGLREVKGGGEARRKVRNTGRGLVTAKQKGSFLSSLYKSISSKKAVIPVPDLPVTRVDSEVAEVLYLHIFTGRGLAAMDAGGTSDPFCTVKLNDLQASTKVIYKTLDPRWDVVVGFPLRGVDINHDVLHFEVFDHDLVCADFLGYCSMSLGSLLLSEAGVKQSRWLALGLRPGQQVANFWHKYFSFEGDIPVQGEIFVTAWMGSVYDAEQNSALHAVKQQSQDKPTPTAKKQPTAAAKPPVAGAAKANVPNQDQQVSCYIAPEFAVCRVAIEEGRDLLACDIGGVSDPYCIVKLGSGESEVSEKTKYKTATLNPKWNENFCFVVPLPLQDTLEITVWDYDTLDFHDIMGTIKIPLDSLPMLKGHKDIPKTEWRPLLNEEAEEDGERRGELKMSAYLDLEYFQHPRDSPLSQPCGRCVVDVLGARGLNAPPGCSYYVVAHLERLWARTPSGVTSTPPLPGGAPSSNSEGGGSIGGVAEVRFDQRLDFPVVEPSSCLVLALFTDTHHLVGKVRIRVSALGGNVRYCKAIQLMKVNPADETKVERTGFLDIAITFQYRTFLGIGWGVMMRYLDPSVPVKNFWLPLPDTVKQRMETRRRLFTSLALHLADPRLTREVSSECLDSREFDFSVRMMKANMARMKLSASHAAKASAAFEYVADWRSPPLTIFFICIVVFFIWFPEHLVPCLMLLVAGRCLLTLSASHNLQMSNIGMDDMLSIGELPEDGQNQDEAKVEPKKQEDEGVDFSDSFNPLASLQKQYQEMTELASVAQTKVGDVASTMERVMSVFNWADPRFTTLVVLGCTFTALLLMIFPLTAFRFKCGMTLGVLSCFLPPALKEPIPSPPENALARIPTLRERVFS